MKLHVQPEHLQIVRDVLARVLSGQQVVLFGSRVTGTEKPTSDLDLAIIGDTPLPISIRSKLEQAFSESALPYLVDIVDFVQAAPSFQEIIRRSGVELSY